MYFVSRWIKDKYNLKTILSEIQVICTFILFIYTLHAYSVLLISYLITLEGRRGTTDDFATIPFHLVLFSAVLVELAKSIPVHSLILSSHLFFCLPFLLFPLDVLCRIVFAKPKDFCFLTGSGGYHILQWLLGCFYEPSYW